MVVVHIANINPSIIGGVQTAVPKMVEAQSHFAAVGLINTHGDAIDGIQNIRYDGKVNIEDLPEPFNKPDLIVFHELYRFEYIAIYRMLIKQNIPYVIIPHGCFSKKAQQKKWIKKKVANFLFFNGFVKNARLIHYLSDNERNMSEFKTLPSCVLGNGVSVPRDRINKFARNSIKFVYIGRLEIRIKGLDLLLGAIKQCESIMREENAIIEIYGPDYEGAHVALTNMINKFNIADIVHLDKEKTGEEKKRILQNATCFVQTSRTEGLPLGPLEALSYGLPCIVTRGVGLGKVIETYGAGYQCDNTVRDISKTLEQFLKNINNIEDMAQSAICLIKENYDIEIIAKKTLTEYCNIIN